jgi:excisionase family DNA binding protein
LATIKRRRIEITLFEQERFFQAAAVAHCPVCRASCEILTPEQAATFMAVQLGTVQRWLAEGQVHGWMLVNGDQRVCKNSLFLS